VGPPFLLSPFVVVVCGDGSRRSLGGLSVCLYWIELGVVVCCGLLGQAPNLTIWLTFQAVF